MKAYLSVYNDVCKVYVNHLYHLKQTSTCYVFQVNRFPCSAFVFHILLTWWNKDENWNSFNIIFLHRKAPLKSGKSTKLSTWDVYSILIGIPVERRIHSMKEWGKLVLQKIGSVHCLPMKFLMLLLPVLGCWRRWSQWSIFCLKELWAALEWFRLPCFLRKPGYFHDKLLSHLLEKSAVVFQRSETQIEKKGAFGEMKWIYAGSLKFNYA